jgi:T1SS-143 domain-containing protein
VATEIGMIKTLIGTAVATAADGSQRTLHAGDRVFQDEVITTDAAGAVEIEFSDGSVMTLGRGSQAVLDIDAFDPQAVAQVPTDVDSEVDALQQALLEGADPSQIGDATAAGAGTGSGGNEGSDVVQILYEAPEVTPESGFDTTGITVEFDDEREEETFDDVPTAGTTTVLLDEDDLVSAQELSEDFEALRAAFEAATGFSAFRANAQGVGDEADGDDLPPSALTVLSGTLAADFGANGAGDIVFNAAATQPAGLTSGGEEIQYFVSEDGHSLIAYTLSEETAEIIFTAEITDVLTGAFTVALYGSVDHPDGATEDNLTVDFGFTISDIDGDTAQGTLRFDIDDDAPATETTVVNLDEDDIYDFRDGRSEDDHEALKAAFDDIKADFEEATEFSAHPHKATGPGVNDEADGDDLPVDSKVFVSNVLTASFGADGPGSITFNANTTQPSGLTSGGEELQYWVSDDGHSLVAYVDFEHGRGRGPQGEDSGEDGSIESHAHIVFTAEIDDDGQYQVILLGPVDHPDTTTEDNLFVDLGYTIVDFDGDSAAGVLRLDIDDDSPVIVDDYYQGGEDNDFRGEDLSVDEDDIYGRGNSDQAPGDDYSNTHLDISLDFGADGLAADDPIALSPEGIVDQNGDALTSNGVELQYTWDGDSDTLIGYTDDVTSPVLTISIGHIDQYGVGFNIDLLDNLDHPINSTEDNLEFNIGYTVTDFDGDSVSSTFAVNVDDDMPTIVSQSNVVDEEGLTGGNAGDSYGEGQAIALFENTTDVAIPNNVSQVTSTIDVSGLSSIADLNVLINLNHTWDWDLNIFLISPEGTRVELSTGNGGSGDNYTNTVFDDEASTNITAGSAPFTGSFRPEGDLSALDGENPNGTWTLEINDQFLWVDDGVLFNWQLQVETGSGDVAGEETTAQGNLGISWGADDRDVDGTDAANQEYDRSVSFDAQSAPVGLTSNGVPIVYTISADGLTLTATAGETVVFTVDISDEGAGTYDFTLLDNLDHPEGATAGEDASPGTEDDLNLEFAFTATDSDGDAVGSHFAITIDDDGPVIGTAEDSIVDEEGLPTGNAGDSYDGTVAVMMFENTTDILIPGTGTSGTVTSSIDVSGLSSIGDLNVLINLDHTWNADLDIFLVSPNGTRVELTTDNGGNSNNYTNTVFDDEASTDISSGSGPFTGSFRPEGDLSDLDGEDPNGTWTLEITDDMGLDVGTLFNWQLQIETGMAADDTAGEALTAHGDLAISWGSDDNNTGVANRSVEFDTDQPGLAGLKSDGEDVVFSLSNDGTVLTATADGDTVFTVSMSDLESGSYDFEQFDNLDHPTADTEDDINLTFNFTVTDSDGDTANSSFTVTVDDDAPVIGEALSENDDNSILLGARDGSAGLDAWGVTPGALTGAVTMNGVTANISFQDNDSNPSSKLRIYNNNANHIGGGSLADNDNEGINAGETLTISFDKLMQQAEIGVDGLGNHFLPDSSQQAHATWVAYKNGVEVGSGEIDNPEGANEGPAGLLEVFTVSIPGGFDTIVLGNNSNNDGSNYEVRYLQAQTLNIVDEEGLQPEGNLGDSYSDNGDVAGAALTTSADLNIIWGADDNNAGDANRSVTFDDVQSGLAGLTSNGVTVTFELSEGDTVLTAKAGEATVFTVTLSDLESGSFDFSLLDNLDHPTVSTEDDINLTFAFTATDSDGDTVNGSFGVTVDDDGPTVGKNAKVKVDDDVLDGNPKGPGDDANAKNVTGTLTHSFGADTEGTVLLLDSHQKAGFTYELNDDGTILTISQGNTAVLQVALDGTTSGNYTVTQLAAIDHPDQTANRENNVEFRIDYQVKDGDGDTKNGKIKINVDDDTPTIDKSSSLAVSEADVDDNGFDVISVTDSLSDIHEGADGATVTSMTMSHTVDYNNLESNGRAVTESHVGNVITGTASDGSVVFTMTYQPDGSYTYVQSQALDHQNDTDLIKLGFRYTVTDADGDTASSALIVSITDDVPTIVATQPTEVAYEFTITNHDDVSSAGYHNSYGYYIKDAVTGEPTTGVVVWDDVKDSDTDPVTVTGYTPDQIGFFIIPNGDNNNGDLTDGAEVTFAEVNGQWQAFVDGTPITGNGSHVLFDVASLNKDGQDHEEDNALIGNQNWEDLQIPNGDGDFNDVNINVEWNQVSNLVVDETALNDSDSTSTSMELAGQFAISPGADGLESVVYELGVSGTSSLVDTASNEEVLLRETPEGVEGYVTAGVVFSLTIDVNGEATLTQFRAVIHDDPTDHDEVTSPAILNAGAITLTALVTDGDGDTASDSIDIGALIGFEDDGPILTADTNSVIEDGEVTVASGNVLANDTVGADGGLVSSAVEMTGTYGSVTINADGEYTYLLNNAAANVQSLAQGQTVTDVFNYTVTDGDGDTAVSTLTIRITGTNDLPEVIALDAQTLEDTSITFTEADLLLGATDVDNNTTLSVENVSLSSGDGTLVDNGDDTWTYTPGINSDVDAVLAFDVSDGIASVPNTMAIDVIAVADAPNLIISVGNETALESEVNLIVNGSFEDVAGHDKNGNEVSDADISAGGLVNRLDITGWTTTAGAPMEPHHKGHAGVSSTDGDNYMDLGASPGNSSISQVISVIEGAEYKLSFDYRDKAAMQEGGQAGEDSGVMQVLWNGVEVATVEGNNRDSWATINNLVLIGAAGTNTLTFAEIGVSDDNWGMAIDNVEMTHVPYQYDVTVTASLTDGDGSETLGVVGIDISLLPNGVTLDGTTLTSDIPLTDEQLNQITGSVTSTETSNNDDATTTETAKVEFDGLDATGETADLLIEGTAAADTIIGGAGDDIIFGGGDSDSLTGGAGADEFVWNKADVTVGTHDTVEDFNITEDVLNLSDLLSDGSHSIEGIEVGAPGSEHLQLNIKDGANNIVQEIELNGVSTGGDAVAALNSLLTSGAIDDGI